jgi:hypothetical protein
MSLKLSAPQPLAAVDPEHGVRSFHALAAGAVAHTVAISSVRRNMPAPIPVLVRGRLAVDRRAQGIQLVHRAIAVSQNTGVVCGPCWFMRSLNSVKA